MSNGQTKSSAGAVVAVIGGAAALGGILAAALSSKRPANRQLNRPLGAAQKPRIGCKPCGGR